VSTDTSESSVHKRRRRAWRNGALLILLGTVVVVVGDLIPGLSDYEMSIFATVGTAIALVGPLSVGERLITFRVEEATNAATAAGSSAEEAIEAASAARDAVANLEGEVREQLVQMRIEDEQRQQNAAEGDQKALVDLYTEAAEHRWIDRRGLRVSAGVEDLWLRVRVVESTSDDTAARSVELAFEGPQLEPIGEPVVWSPNEGRADVPKRLAHQLMEADRWPGDDAFSRSNLLGAATDAIAKVRNLHVGPERAHDVGPVVEFVSVDWAVTSGGLESLQANICVKRDHLLHQTSQALEGIEAELKADGLDLTAFAAVFGAAKRVCEGLRREDLDPIKNFKL
jgi:hypothetical protein